MDRRTFIGSAGAGLVARSLPARAQEAGRTYRLGILSPGNRPTSGGGLTGSLAANLREHGYIEGRNLVVQARYAETRPERLPGLARELAQLKPDVIVAIGTAAIQAAMLATSTVPIVFLTNVDPVAAGLVRSLAQPAGNVTGILIAPDGTLAAKKLEILREVVPKAARIALLVPDDPSIGVRLQVEETRKAAAALGVELTVVVAQRRDYAAAFAAIAASRSSALFVGAHSLFLADRRQIIELAAKHRLPAVYEWPQHVKDGGLMSYGASDTEIYLRVADYVDKVFRGAKPGELPVEQPSKLLLVLNVGTAKAMGVTIPQSLLLRVDEVIQ